jgi:hypothetical protein
MFYQFLAPRFGGAFFIKKSLPEWSGSDVLFYWVV